MPQASKSSRAARQATTPKPLPHSQNRLPGCQLGCRQAAQDAVGSREVAGDEAGHAAAALRKRSMRRSASREKRADVAGQVGPGARQGQIYQGHFPTLSRPEDGRRRIASPG